MLVISAFSQPHDEHDSQNGTDDSHDPRLYSKLGPHALSGVFHLPNRLILPVCDNLGVI